MPTRYFPSIPEELGIFRELAVRRARAASMEQQATEGQARAAGAIHRDYPHMKPGLVEALVRDGVTDPADPRVQAISDKSAQYELTHGMGMLGTGDKVSPSQVKAQGTAEVDTSWTQPLRDASRKVFTGMRSAAEEAGSAITAAMVARSQDDVSMREAWERRAPSIGRLAKDENLDLGTGWFPGGEAEEALKRRRQRLTTPALQRGLEPGNQEATPGRLITSMFQEPGSGAFDTLSGVVDGALSFATDPTAIALGGANKVAKARKAFNSKPDWMPALARRAGAKTGLISGRRRTVLPEQAQNWWEGAGEAKRLRQWLVNEDSPYEVWTALRKGVDHKTAKKIADAQDELAVTEAIGPELGLTIREKPVGSGVNRALGAAVGSQRGRTVGLTNAMRAGVHGKAGQVVPGFDDVRLLQWAPHRAVESRDITQAAEDLDRWMKGAKMDRGLRSQRISQVLELEEGDTAGLFNVTKQIMDDAVVEISNRGVSQAKAQEITRLFGDDIDTLRAYNIDEIGNETAHPLLSGDSIIMQDGMAKVVKPGPHLSSELINRKIPLPDMQAIRQHTTGLMWKGKTPFDIPGYRHADQYMRGLMSNLWKPLQLLRLAYVARVGGEEQARLAGAGYDSLINHPFRYIMAQAGRRGKGTVGDKPWQEVDEFAAQMQRFGSRWDNRVGGHMTRDWQVVGKNHPRAVDGWANEILFHVNDPLSARVANNGLLKGDRSPATDLEGLDAVKDWFWRGTGKKFRRELSEAREEILTNRAVADEYVDSVAERLSIKTNGNDEIRQAVVSGRIDGKQVRGVPPNIAFRDTKKALKDRQDFIPDWVKTRRGEAEDMGLKDRALNFMGDAIMSHPTNRLSRAPMFKQAHWDEASRLAQFADEGTQKAILAAAKKNKANGKQLQAIEEAIAGGPGSHLDDISRVDELANAHAAGEVKRMLYDLTERGQLSDMAHNIAPFLEAQKEIMVAWGRLVKRNPKIPRRFQQGVEGARGGGHFYEDENGEEMFRYPGTGLISRLLLDNDSEGTTAGFVGRVAGANLFAGTMLPGFGPAVQLPASVLLDNKPKWDTLREEVLFPFGEPEGPMDALRPAWAGRIAQYIDNDPESDRIYGNSVFDVAKALAQTGEYDLNSEEGLKELQEAALEKGRKLMFWRGVAQSILPTGPQVEFTTEDIEGESWSFQTIGSEFNRLRGEVGHQEAVQEFLTRFGPDAHVLVQAKSKEIVKRSTSKKGFDWERENQHIMDRYNLAAGYVAGDDPDGEFHYPAYERQFAKGTRENLTPEQSLRLANEMKARMIYDRAKLKAEEAGSTVKSRQWLVMVRQKLREEYPGFDGFIGEQERARTEHVIRDMQRMVDDPELQENDAVQGLRLYLRARDKAQDAADQIEGVSKFQQAKSTAHIREWLRRVADVVASEHPQFLPMWDRVFSRELADDQEQEFALPGAEAEDPPTQTAFEEVAA